jgi:hypothetical protein
MKSMEQLEQEALLSGDWSAVERRERLIARQAKSATVKQILAATSAPASIRNSSTRF